MTFCCESERLHGNLSVRLELALPPAIPCLGDKQARTRLGGTIVISLSAKICTRQLTLDLWITRHSLVVEHNTIRNARGSK